MGQDFLRIHFAFQFFNAEYIYMPVYKIPNQTARITQNTRLTYFANINQFVKKFRDAGILLKINCLGELFFKSLYYVQNLSKFYMYLYVFVVAFVVFTIYK